MPSPAAVTGISDHGGWAILVTATQTGQVLDRRRVELVAPDLPPIPHHSEGKSLPMPQAVALVERVQLSAAHHAKLALDTLAREVHTEILGVALRHCPPLPPTIAERIIDYRASNVADWVLYRHALAAAAQARGWAIHWYDPKAVLATASDTLDLRRTLGPPWTRDHKLALAAAIHATR